MAILTIPKELRAGMAEILEISDQSFNEIASVLIDAPLAFQYEELADKVRDKFKSISQDAIEDMFQTLIMLYTVRDTAGVPSDDFINDIVEGIEEDDAELKEALSRLTPDRFRERLSILLSNKALAFTAKACSKQNAHEKTFCSAQMLTDVRPVFGSNGNAAPVAAIPIHTLSISYHHGRILKEIFIALDADDLDTLEGLIYQAREEANQLKSILSRAEVPYPEEG
jgi:hypothetical protein